MNIWNEVASAISAGHSRASPDGVWERLRVLSDPAEFRPRLAADVMIKDFRLRWGNDYSVVTNPSHQIHYRLEPWEATLLRSMDGSRTVGDLVEEHFRRTEEFDPETVTNFVHDLHANEFFDEPYLDTDGAIRRALKPERRRRAKARRFVRTLEVEWEGAEKLVQFLYRNGLRIFFTKSAMVVSVALALAGLTAFSALAWPGHYRLEPTNPGLEFAVLMGLNLLLISIHELAHALVLVHNGGRVKSIGFRIYYGAPAFFVDASDAQLLERRQRILQAFAGPFSELVVAAPAALYVWLVPDGWGVATISKWAVLNYLVVFMNLIPLLELDGYWILSDAIQVPDLRARSLAFIRRDLWRKLRSRDQFRLQEIGLGLYATIGVAFAIFSLYITYFFWKRLFFGMISRMWNGGPISRVLLLALGVFLAGPLVRAAIRILGSVVRGLRRLAHGIWFRLQSRWRIEAAELLEGQATLEQLPIEALNDLAGRARLRRVSPGEIVVRQGEYPRGYFVVRTGTLEVVEEDGDASRVLRTLGRGAGFGELALAHRAPRSATVRGLTRAQVFDIPTEAFDRLLAGRVPAGSFAPTVQQLRELADLECFRHLEMNQLSKLLRAGKWINYAPGVSVAEEGKSPDGFYAIGSGQAEVVEGTRVVRKLGPGSWFGERGLLSGAPRSATVRTLTPLRAFKLSRRGFDRLVRGAFRRGLVTPHQSPAGHRDH